MTQPALSARDLLRWPPTVDVAAGGRAFGLGRSTAYALARSDQFPCKVIRAGRSYRVITADLLRVLNICSDNSDGAGAGTPTPSETPRSTSAN
nr:DNA-binding protein [Kitasatospora sp. CB02891]